MSLEFQVNFVKQACTHITVIELPSGVFHDDVSGRGQMLSVVPPPCAKNRPGT